MTFVAAAATATTALLTAAAVTSGSPRAHATAIPGVSTLSAASAVHSAGPAGKLAPAGQVGANPAHPRPSQPSGHAHLAVKVHPRGRAAVRRHAAAKAPAKRALPYRMYDSVNPSAIPAHQAVAAYSTGSYYARPSQLRGLGHALWIDTTGRNYGSSVLDVEPGDATPAQAASWAWHRLRASHHGLARIYTMRSEWGAVQAAMHGLPSWMQARVHWWIADPTGVPHIVPGAHATQWYWGSSYDISAVKPGF